MYLSSLLAIAAILQPGIVMASGCQPCNKKAIVIRIMPADCGGSGGISPQTIAGATGTDSQQAAPTGAVDLPQEKNETVRVFRIPANARIVRRVTTTIIEGRPQIVTRQQTVTKTVTEMAVLEKQLLSTSFVTTRIRTSMDCGRKVTVTSTLTLNALPSDDPKFTTVIKQYFVTLVKGDTKANAKDIITKELMLKAVEAYMGLGIVKGAAAIPEGLYEAYVKYVTPGLSFHEQVWLLATLLFQSQGFTKLEEKGSADPFRGRGLMNLSWDGNYKAASEYIYKDDRLVKNPDLVAKPEGSWLTALWFWMTQIRPRLLEKNALDAHDYGHVIDVVNGVNECSGGPSAQAKQRGKLLQDLYSLFKLQGTVSLGGCQRTPPAAAAKAELPPAKKENELTKAQLQSIFDSWTKTGGYGSPVPLSDDLYKAYQEKIAPIMSLKEQAQFLAILVYQSNGLQKKPTEDCKAGKCPEGKYYGRGLMNLSWDFNYKAANEALYPKDPKTGQPPKENLVDNPDLASTPNGSWLTAHWFWTANIRQRVIDNKALDSNEFGLAVDAVNGFGECTGGPSKEAKDRLKIYDAILEITKIGGKGKLDLCNRPGPDKKPSTTEGTTGTSTKGTGTGTGTATGTSTKGTTSGTGTATGTGTAKPTGNTTSMSPASTVKPTTGNTATNSAAPTTTTSQANSTPKP